MLAWVLFLYMSSNAAAGAVSRKSTNSYVPLLVLSNMKPPPPIPLWYMATVPMQKTVPTTASTALPPSSSSLVPILLQIPASEATAPSFGTFLPG